MTRIDALLGQLTECIGGDEARLEAELLLAEALNCSRTHLLTHPERQLDDTAVHTATALAQRRAQGEPVAYILGHWGFWTLDLLVSRAVLIPRPESERLVEIALTLLDIDAPDKPVRIADLGTGSGALALALASERADWVIQAVEHDPAALRVARENGRRLGLDRNIDWCQGDWCAPLTPPLHAIVANPPYIAAGDPHLDALAHEPASALIAADGGLADMRAIIAQAPDYLRPQGWLLLEIGATQGDAVRELWQRDERWEAPRHWHDWSGHERVVGARRR